MVVVTRSDRPNRGRHGRRDFSAREAADLRQALEDRKVIERAKGVLMKELGLGEAEAFRRLQKTAASKNLKLIELARMALTTAGILKEA